MSAKVIADKCDEDHARITTVNRPFKQIFIPRDRNLTAIYFTGLSS
jgi:hypothetical protein